MSHKSRAATRSCKATYRKFGNIAQYNGRDLLYMTDIEVKFEHGLQKVVKVQTWQLNLLDIKLNELRLNAHTLGIGRNMYRIIAYEFYGNDDEEVLLTLEGDDYRR